MNFDQAIKLIKDAYFQIGHKLGYRFLLSSKSTFYSDILLLNLNPGGNRIPSDHPSDSCESGPAYITEVWSSPIQLQVQRLFAELSKKIPGNRDLINESLIAYFIPFRSPKIESLHAKAESVQFSIKLWSSILSSLKPKLIICLGEEVFKNVLKILNEDPVRIKTKIGWGNVTAELYISQNGCRILRLPHLSTYRIFSSPKCKPNIEELLNKLVVNW